MGTVWACRLSLCRTLTWYISSRFVPAIFKYFKRWLTAGNHMRATMGGDINQIMGVWPGSW